MAYISILSIVSLFSSNHKYVFFVFLSLLHFSETLNVDCKADRQISVAGPVSWSCSLSDLNIGWIRLNLRDALIQKITTVANPIYLDRN